VSRPRLKNWRDKPQVLAAEMEDLLDAWSDDLDDKDESIETTTAELEEARIEAAQPPEWGNCKRGCPPAYLDREGFCSPACKLGAPRGEFVTLNEMQPITPRAFS